MTPRRSVASALAFAGVALAPALASACPVCFSARGGTRLAYVGTAILMSLLPLAMFGIVGWWIRRAVRDHEGRAQARVGTGALVSSATETPSAASRTEAASTT